MPICNHQLTSDDLTQLKDLVRRCQTEDGNTIPIYSHILLQRRALPCNVLLYHQQKLIGFLSVFFFYTNGCELILMIDPKWRRQGLAMRLYAMIKPVLQSRMLDFIDYLSPKSLNETWLPKIGLRYHNSEYQMQWAGSTLSLPERSNVSFRQAQQVEDIDLLTKIDVVCFHSNEAELKTRFHRLLADEQYTLWFIYHDRQLVGKAHLYHAMEHTMLSDIAILPAYQRQGLGSALVSYCIKSARKKNHLPIRLEVESNNHKALNLYLKLGFKITNAWDIWRSFDCLIPTN